MRNECLGIINLNKKGDPAINKLNYGRPIASTPIAGRYRIIDFALSNMINSGITKVGIFAKEKYRSLTDHIGSGKDWDLSRKKGGLSIFSPENTKYRNTYSHREGDIYTILANLDYIEKSEEEYILIAPSYMLCNLNYSQALEYHKKSHNDITIIYKNVNNANKDFAGNLTLNLGNYCYLEEFIIEEAENMKIGAYEYTGYLKCVNSVESYFEMSKDLLNLEVADELLYSERKIFTKEKNESPTIYTDSAKVENSFIASGCLIEGTVKDSIIFRKVNVEKGTVIENSIVMQNCVIKSNAKLYNAILDKNTSVSNGKELRGDEKYPLVVEKNTNI